jgi:hypothetical protein
VETSTGNTLLKHVAPGTLQSCPEGQHAEVSLSGDRQYPLHLLLKHAAPRTLQSCPEGQHAEVSLSGDRQYPLHLLLKHAAPRTLQSCPEGQHAVVVRPMSQTRGFKVHMHQCLIKITFCQCLETRYCVPGHGDPSLTLYHAIWIHCIHAAHNHSLQ